ncbi:unnamed protein product, partial [marine sediment metagenome]
AATMVVHMGRASFAFDDTAEEAITTPETEVPQGNGGYAGGTLNCDIHFYMASEDSAEAVLDVFVESKTSDTDTLDMTATASWDSANSGTTTTISASTAGDPLRLSIELTNDDSIAAGDIVRFGVRRDCDSGSDLAGGDLYISAIEIWETV